MGRSAKCFVALMALCCSAGPLPRLAPAEVSALAARDRAMCCRTDSSHHLRNYWMWFELYGGYPPNEFNVYLGRGVTRPERFRVAYGGFTAGLPCTVERSTTGPARESRPTACGPIFLHLDHFPPLLETIKAWNAGWGEVR